MPRYNSQRTISAVIAGGGSGTRIGGPVPKQLLRLSGKPILFHAVERILRLQEVVQVVITLPAGYVRPVQSMIRSRRWRVTPLCIRGGANRQASVLRGVERTLPDVDMILVHDAVRPLCDLTMLERVVDAAWRRGGAVPGLAATETIQRVSPTGRVLKSPPRSELFAIQTPQCFHARIVRSALAKAKKSGYTGTDESSVVRWAGYPVYLVEGSGDNIKITQPRDLEIAERLHAGQTGGASSPRRMPESGEMNRIGQGVDYHRLVRGRKLILGGVEIPHDKGLAGHSDADVLSHAVCDALLGAAALGDIGQHFPDNDPDNRDRSSLDFLQIVRDKVESEGWKIRNVDATLLAYQPKLSIYFAVMRENIARALRLPNDDVSVKATTTEGMNAEGRGEGISAQAVALLQKQ
jgi:2-C-methyl-D-erythritol 4-phosphate cytidylyltransferase/2-C-methyl-D-erythritol 2,4-cyclodiphosphate synthase